MRIFINRAKCLYDKKKNKTDNEACFAGKKRGGLIMNSCRNREVACYMRCLVSVLVLCCILFAGCGIADREVETAEVAKEQTQQSQDESQNESQNESISQASDPDEEQTAFAQTDADAKPDEENVEADMEADGKEAADPDETKESAKAEIEYEGLVCRINATAYDLQELGSPANAIMDAKQVGDWVIIEGHVNPHVGVYHIVSLLTGKMEYTLSGAGLTWPGEDVTKGVYSAYHEIYDFEGHVIGKTNGAEVSELSISEDGTEITAVDFDGNTFVFHRESGGIKEDGADAADGFSKLLALYKEAQDGAYSQEQVESLGLKTELLQNAWPWAASEEAVRYLFFDVDQDGKDELIITYYGEIKDIYGSDGKGCVYAYGCPYRGIASIYNDGMLEELMAATMQSASTTWYRYDAETGRYFPLFGMHYTPGKNEAENATYYTFACDEKLDEAKESCKETGEMPVWIWDHARDLTEEEYNAMCPKTEEVKLPEGNLLSGFKPR